MYVIRNIVATTLVLNFLCFEILAYATTDNNTIADNSNRVFIIQSGYDVINNNELRVASSIALIKSDTAIVVTDPGMTANKQTVIDGILDKGVKLTDVTHVFVSHHHIDHTLQLGIFPNAVVVDYASIYEKDIWREHDGNYTIAPGITVIATPGHTHEDASLLITTKEGIYAVTHAWWHEDMTPVIDPFAEHAENLTISRKLILSQADWIFPGHGKLFKNPNKQ